MDERILAAVNEGVAADGVDEGVLAAVVRVDGGVLAGVDEGVTADGVDDAVLAAVDLLLEGGADDDGRRPGVVDQALLEPRSKAIFSSSREENVVVVPRGRAAGPRRP